MKGRASTRPPQMRHSASPRTDPADPSPGRPPQHLYPAEEVAGVKGGRRGSGRAPRGTGPEVRRMSGAAARRRLRPRGGRPDLVRKVSTTEGK
jgi:hypothetical protein